MGLKLDVRIDGIDATIRAFRRFGSAVAGPAIARMLKQGAMTLRDRQKSRQPPHVNTGTTFASTRVQHVETQLGGPGAIMEVGIRGADSPTAIYQEIGRQPGAKFPPPDNIRQWIQQRGLGENASKEYEIKAVVYAISAAIANLGWTNPSSSAGGLKPRSMVFDIKRSASSVAYDFHPEDRQLMEGMATRIEDNIMKELSKD